MKELRLSQSQIWLVMLCLLFSLRSGAAQFVELTAEIAFDDWDYRFWTDRIIRDIEANPSGSPSIFPTNATVQCVVGTNTWLIEREVSNRKQKYWFTGSNIISHSVTSQSNRVNTQIDESSDGNPGRPLRVADLLPFDVTARICWLAFCSGPSLKRDDRQIFPPNDLWKESAVAFYTWSDETILFKDGLGLPKSMDLVATNNQPIFQYQVRRTTNVLGWTFPVEFYCVQYRSTGSNIWKVHLTAKGRVTSIKEGAKLDLSPEK